MSELERQIEEAQSSAWWLYWWQETYKWSTRQGAMSGADDCSDSRFT